MNQIGRFKKWCIDAFPPPRFVMMPSVALDISPNSIKYLSGTHAAVGYIPQTFREVFLPENTIVNGVVQDYDAFVSALREIHIENGKVFAFVSLPESALYLYTAELKGSGGYAAIRQQIEFSFNEHVPLSLQDAVYDFDIVETTRSGVLVSVTVAPREVITVYTRAFDEVGFMVRAIELEAHAIARSVSPVYKTPKVSMIVDVGHNRTGIIVAKNSVPIFSTTVPGGVDNVSHILAECKRQYTFWDTRTDTNGKRIERVADVLVTGGGSAAFLPQLNESLGITARQAQVWQYLFDINEYIPEIHATESHAMATVAGLLARNTM